MSGEPRRRIRRERTEQPAQAGPARSAALAGGLALAVTLVAASCSRRGSVEVIPDARVPPDTAIPCARRCVRTIAGNGATGVRQLGPALRAVISMPRGLALAPGHGASVELYIADQDYESILGLHGGEVTTVARFDPYIMPFDVAVDRSGALIAAIPYSRRLLRIAGGKTTILASPEHNGNIGRPHSVAVAADGAIYIAEGAHQRISVYRDGKISVFAGAGPPGGRLDGPRLSARFKLPKGIAVDAHGDIYVADTGNHLIRRIHDDRVETIAGSGEEGYADGPALQAKLETPREVAVGPKGRLYIATLSRIRLLDGGVISTIAGSGGTGVLDGPALQAELADPQDLAVDRTGRVFIADGEGHRIRVYEP